MPNAEAIVLDFNHNFFPKHLPFILFHFPPSSMTTYLRVVGGLAGLVLRDLVDGVLLALLALTKGLALFGDAHHLSLFLCELGRKRRG